MRAIPGGSRCRFASAPAQRQLRQCLRWRSHPAALGRLLACGTALKRGQQRLLADPAEGQEREAPPDGREEGWSDGSALVVHGPVRRRCARGERAQEQRAVCAAGRETGGAELTANTEKHPEDEKGGNPPGKPKRFLTGGQQTADNSNRQAIARPISGRPQSGSRKFCGVVWDSGLAIFVHRAHVGRLLPIISAACFGKTLIPYPHAHPFLV